MYMKDYSILCITLDFDTNFKKGTKGDILF